MAQRMSADDVAALFAARMTARNFSLVGGVERGALGLSVKQTTWLCDVSPRDERGIRRTHGAFTHEGRAYTWNLHVWPNGAGVLSVVRGKTAAEWAAERAAQAASMARYEANHAIIMAYNAAMATGDEAAIAPARAALEALRATMLAESAEAAEATKRLS